MLYKGPTPKAGVTLNGKDILEYDPLEIKEWIDGLPKNEKKIIRAILKSRINQPAEGYAKAYGRPSLAKRPYMTCENDGYPYLEGHAPNCSGEETYSQWPLQTKEKICWCAWIGAKKGSEDAYARRLWETLDMD